MIVADNSFAAQSIRLALRQTAGFQVVAIVDGMVALDSRVAELQPDVVVIDEMQEPEHAYARLAELANVVPDAKRVFLTMRMDDDTLPRVFDCGADAAISKMVHPVSLGTLLREISRDAVVHYARPMAKTARADCPLTERELEILGLVAQGYTNGRIARELWVTEQTVKFHLSNTYRKLGVANRTEASRYAYVHDVTASRERLAPASSRWSHPAPAVRPRGRRARSSSMRSPTTTASSRSRRSSRRWRAGLRTSSSSWSTPPSDRAPAPRASRSSRSSTSGWASRP